MTLSKFDRAGFFNFGFVFEIYDFEIHCQRRFQPTLFERALLDNGEASEQVTGIG